LWCEDGRYRHGPTVFAWFSQPEFYANRIASQESELRKSSRWILIWTLLAGYWSGQSCWNSKLS
jgi:hypothetical protein